MKMDGQNYLQQREQDCSAKVIGLDSEDVKSCTFFLSELNENCTTYFCVCTQPENIRAQCRPLVAFRVLLFAYAHFWDNASL